MNNIANALHLSDKTQRAIVPRSKERTSFIHRTTFPHGKLVPIYCMQALPGASYNISAKSFVRLATPLTATMDNLVADVAFYFVPDRIIFSNFEKVMGITEDGTWNTPNVTKFTKLYSYTYGATTAYNENDLGQYLGLVPQGCPIPSTLTTGQITDLPIKAYCQIWNDYYRDPNFERVIPFSKTNDTGCSTRPSSITEATWMNHIVQGYGLAPVCKNRDLFTMCYSAPQKGGSVAIPMNNASLKTVSTNNVDFNTSQIPGGLKVYNNGITNSSIWTNPDTQVGPNQYNVIGSNLGILANDVAGTINQLREAFAIQCYLENDMQNRYKDSLLAHFGVSNRDDVLQRAQYIGGNRFRINMNSVVQNTSATVSGGTTPAGYVAGYSATFDENSNISFTANEHGWLIGVVCTRIERHSYSQGMNPQFLLNDRFSIYSPEFANLPYMAVSKSCLYFDGSTPNFNSVFGYAPAWWQYRERFNYNSGLFATQNAQTLDYWHYGDYYSSSPTLQASFLHEESYQLSRTIAISAEQAHPYKAEFYFDECDILPMPSYSKPGLPIHA